MRRGRGRGAALGLLLAAAGGGAGAAEEAAAARLEARLAEARATCAEWEGRFTLAEDAITEVPVGEGVAVTVVWEGGFRCSTAASLWCGSGGCMLHLLAQDQALSRQATGWRAVDWGPARVFLIGRDGGWCGGAGAEVCFEAVVWSAGRFLTLSDR